MKNILRAVVLAAIGLSLLWACATDQTLREYLSFYFWLPFSKHGDDFARDGEPRLSAPFAGMGEAQGQTPLAALRAAYQDGSLYNPEKRRSAFAAARSAPSLTPRDREEIALLDAKIDVRVGQLEAARNKLEEFLKTAYTPEYLSEARGWLAHIHYRLGEQSAAGKMYLDELNRRDSNLSQETLLTSLRMTYGYDGGIKLREHLEDYFDTPEHAAFAIQLTTNPDRYSSWASPPDTEITKLLEKHASLFQSEKGAQLLATLGMRAALSAGDPPAALRIAAKVPANSAARSDPDFLWMLGSAHFLSRQYLSAQTPLLRLFSSGRASPNQKAAAAYGLCGVYQKTGNPIERLRFALWLNNGAQGNDRVLSYPGTIQDQTIYWAASGYDLGLLLDAEAPIEALRAFLQKYPAMPDVRLVKYSLAVRLARENRYDEAAQIYEEIDAGQRAARMRELSALYHDANLPDMPPAERETAKFKLAEFLSDNPERIYFNDQLWNGFQRYALTSATDSRLTRAERQRQIAIERKLKDDQEELWRAYLILRDVVRESGKTDTGKSAAQLAVNCLRRISSRFERQSEIYAADIELSSWLRRTP